MIDTKNIETALEHLENARKMLDLQLKNRQNELSEERADMIQQKELLQEERRQFEEQKEVILNNLKQLQQQLQEELQGDDDKFTMSEALAIESPLEEAPKAQAMAKTEVKAEEKPDMKPVAAESSFIELDDDEFVAENTTPQENEKKKASESAAPILGMAVPVNDLASSLQHQPLKDLGKGMGINDRFLFTNELFDGSSNTFNEVVKKLNNLGNLPEATAYLSRFSDKWDLESDVVRQFMLLVHRRYL